MRWKSDGSGAVASRERGAKGQRGKGITLCCSCCRMSRRKRSRLLLWAVCSGRRSMVSRRGSGSRGGRGLCC